MTSPPSMAARQWQLWLAFPCCYLLAYVVPRHWSWENGVIENIQVAVLLGGALHAAAVWHREGAASIGAAARCVFPVWIMLVGRELSWGAVFLAPAGFTDQGAWYSSRHLWYRPAVTPVLIALLAWPVWSAWRSRLDRILLGGIASRRAPWMGLSLILGAAACSTCAEQAPGFILAPLHAQRFEELTELVGYVVLLMMQRSMIGSRGGALAGPSGMRNGRCPGLR